VSRSIMGGDRPVTQLIAIPEPGAPHWPDTCTPHGAMDFSWDGQSTQITPSGNQCPLPVAPEL